MLLKIWKGIVIINDNREISPVLINLQHIIDNCGFAKYNFLKNTVFLRFSRFLKINIKAENSPLIIKLLMFLL